MFRARPKLDQLEEQDESTQSKPVNLFNSVKVGQQAHTDTRCLEHNWVNKKVKGLSLSKLITVNCELLTRVRTEAQVKITGNLTAIHADFMR
ncbi:hypothetical protein HanHA300_Chr04g0150171 [Helianthus annuus]|nr:hypothetical protein HanHA300_Chr04g0150171 [Helianthus annuus]KAJ0598230.1 hypothetical protein HanHA89_Chr04g0163481 [Helianthus annuus]KAJ0758864.1 hypothetical protein HanLR1_Chr04g0155091 [Helianthus annuus]